MLTFCESKVNVIEFFKETNQFKKNLLEAVIRLGRVTLFTLF